MADEREEERDEADVSHDDWTGAAPVARVTGAQPKRPRLARKAHLKRSGFKVHSTRFTHRAQHPEDGNRPRARKGIERRPWKLGAWSSLHPRSQKQEDRDERLARLKAELIQERGPWCQVCQILWRHRTGQAMSNAMTSDGCSGWAEDLHHVLPKSLGGKDVRPNLLLAGRIHHDWLEDAPNRALAKRLGLLRGTAPAAFNVVESEAS